MVGEPHPAGIAWPIGWGMVRKRDGELCACPILYRNEERIMTRKDYNLIAEAIAHAKAATADYREPEKAELNYPQILNRVLPQEIRVLAWAPVPDEFSAR